MTHGPAVQSGPDSNPVPGAGITPMTDEATGSDSVPALGSVYFYLTEGCNLACRHCWLGPQFDQNGKTRASLPLDLFKSVVSQGKALGMDRLKLTGGEPLLHPEIADILRVVREASHRAHHRDQWPVVHEGAGGGDRLVQWPARFGQPGRGRCPHP